MFFWKVVVSYYNEETIHFVWKHILQAPETNPLYSVISYGILKHNTVHSSFTGDPNTQTCGRLASVTNSGSDFKNIYLCDCFIICVIC